MCQLLHSMILVKIFTLGDVNRLVKVLNYVSTFLMRKDCLVRNVRILLQSFRMLGIHTKFSAANPNGRPRRR